MKLRWTVAAKADFGHLTRFVAQQSLASARKISEHILEESKMLPDWPQVGRIGRIEGTRELIVNPYIIVYRIDAATIFILRIYHSAQDWP